MMQGCFIIGVTTFMFSFAAAVVMCVIAKKASHHYLFFFLGTLFHKTKDGMDSALWAQNNVIDV